MIKWTSLAPWEFEILFPGSLTSTFRVEARKLPASIPAILTDTTPRCLGGGSRELQCKTGAGFVGSMLRYSDWTRQVDLPWLSLVKTAQIDVDALKRPCCFQKKLAPPRTAKFGVLSGPVQPYVFLVPCLAPYSHFRFCVVSTDYEPLGLRSAVSVSVAPVTSMVGSASDGSLQNLKGST